ncbi:hypothetical protein L3X38_017681 [Prunus dulcis]|uniref:Uncharacterized protein n=1 Tax=Prunus dulcis TaxID=3755 RepID=A0AAD4ZA06_PRUDU|nr:hypothetical protein L3X38_017681 [Prunus dulcis]
MPTGEDRFYIPVKARKRYNNQQKQARKAKNDANENPKELPKSKVVVSEKRSPKEPPNTLANPSSESSLKPSSNLDRLLESTTPSVPAQYFSKGLHLPSLEKMKQRF